MQKRVYETPALVRAGSFSERTGIGDRKGPRDHISRRWFP